MPDLTPHTMLTGFGLGAIYHEQWIELAMKSVVKGTPY